MPKGSKVYISAVSMLLLAFEIGIRRSMGLAETKEAQRRPCPKPRRSTWVSKNLPF